MADQEARVTLDSLKPLVSEASTRFSVPEEYIWNVIRAENSGSAKGASELKDAPTNAVSSKNARGLMQITPVALQDVTEAGLVPSGLSQENLSVADQINVGTAYLSRLMKLSQKPEEIYAMYNFGPKARFQMDNLPDETRGYLQKTGSSQSTTTKTGGGPTGTFGGGMMSSADLIGFLRTSAEQQNNAIVAAAGESAKLQSRSEQAAANAVDIEQQAVGDAANNAAAKVQIQYQQNKVLENLQSLFNMNPSQTDNEIAKNLNAAQTAASARVPIFEEYNKLAAINPLENPLGYILAQVQLPSVAARNNALAQAEDTALQNIDIRTRQLAAAKSTLTANTADSIKATQLEDARIASNSAQANLLKEESKNSASAATNRLQQAQIANLVGDNTRQTLTAIIGLQDRETSNTLRDEQRQLLIDAKNEKAEDDAVANARLKVVSDALALELPMTVQRLKGLASKDKQDKWRKVATTAKFGDDMKSSVEFYLQESNETAISNQGDASVISTARKLEQAGSKYVSYVERAAVASGQKSTPTATREKAFDHYTGMVVDSTSSPTNSRDLSSPQWDSDYNPYKAPYIGFAGAIDTNPKFAQLKNNIVKQKFDMMVKGGSVQRQENLNADQQQQLLLSVFDDVRTRKLTTAQAAAGISEFYKAAATWNAQTNKYTLFGLPLQNNYLFTLEGGFGVEGRKVDLMNPVDVDNMLAKRLRSYISAGQLPDAVPFKLFDFKK